MPKPWLLDHNVPAQLARWLTDAGIPAETVARKDWQELRDKELVLAAGNEFEVLVTRDRTFAQAAGAALANSNLAVVLLSIRQARAGPFVEAFDEAWQRGRPEIQPGRVVRWPPG